MEHARYLINEHLHNLRMARPWTAPDAGRCDLWLIQSAMLRAIPDDDVGVTAAELRDRLKLTESQFDRGIRKLREANQIRGQRRELHKVFIGGGTNEASSPPPSVVIKPEQAKPLGGNFKSEETRARASARVDARMAGFGAHNF